MIQPTNLQLQAIENHVKVFGQHRFSLEASETGLGKTIIAVFTAKALDLPIGVICKASARAQWKEEIEKCGFDSVDFVESYDTLRRGNHFAVERIKKGKSYKFLWKAGAPCLLIFDEVHMCSGLGTQNSYLLRDAFTHPMIKIIGLSATVSNSPLKMSTIGVCLGLHQGKDWWSWCLRSGCVKNPWGGLLFYAKPGGRAEECLKLMHRHIFPARGYRLTYDDLDRGSLKENSIQPIRVDTRAFMTSSLIESALEDIAVKEVEDLKKATEKGEAVSAFTLTTRSRQKEELYKVPWLIEEALEIVEQNKMVLIFVQYTETRQLLLSKLKSFKSISGQDSFESRKEIQKQAALNTIEGIVLQIDAGAASLNLQDILGTKPRFTLILPTYSAEVLKQALGRAYRLTTQSPVVQKLVFSTSYGESRIYSAVKAKINQLDLLNDGELRGEIF